MLLGVGRGEELAREDDGAVADAELLVEGERGGGGGAGAGGERPANEAVEGSVEAGGRGRGGRVDGLKVGRGGGGGGCPRGLERRGVWSGRGTGTHPADEGGDVRGGDGALGPDAEDGVCAGEYRGPFGEM